ncbi:MAG: AraC family transcriptional regulator [Bacteroidota bacterium]
MMKKNLETIVHLLFWLWYFTAINVDWTSDWFDRSLRTNTPAPLSVILFPILFYVHTFWIIPKFLKKEKWMWYTLGFIGVFILPEIIRSGLMSWLGERTFSEEILSRDSLIFGAPSVFWVTLVASFGYRFTKDWFAQQRKAKVAESLPNNASPKMAKAVVTTLDDEEATTLMANLKKCMLEKKPYTDPELSLSKLAQRIETTDKKLSILLNQNMETNFYDYLNTFRINDFKAAVKSGKLNNLSITGLAAQCGFKSKSSFYRAFKKETGMTPTAYFKSQNP